MAVHQDAGKAEWIARFRDTLLKGLRPDLGPQFCETVAWADYAEHRSEVPEEAAHRWYAESLQPPDTRN